MVPNPTDRREIRLYLLGRLEPEPSAERVEERVLTEADYYEELLVVEDELIDEYLSGELNAVEREAFEHHFLCTPERVKKLKFARTFDSYVSAAPRPVPAPRRGVSAIFGALWGSPARAASFALVVVAGFALTAWLVYFKTGSEFDEGLAALRTAYRERRPVEARMAGFGYAPWILMRDGSAPPADAVTLDRAEFLLRDAAHKHPGPDADHALGSLYLAKRQYDQAISLFESALKTDERNARLHNDLGVALFEQAQRLPAQEGEEKGIETLARSAEHFERAVELDNTFLEARFNRALAYQNMQQWRQAEEDWKDYLRRDEASHWADEARTHLKEIEERVRATSQAEGQGPRDFLDAWHAGNDAAAWGVVSRSYTSAGNEVVNGLLDSLLAPATPGAPAADREVLPALSYLARLTSEKADDRFVTDLVNHYEQMPQGQRPLLAEARGHLKAGQSLFAGMKWAGAFNEFTAARLAYERAGDAAGKALTDYRLAHCQIFLGEYEKARLAFESLYADCEAKQYRWVAARSLYGLAHVSIDRGEFSKAADYSGRALADFERGEDRDGVLRCLTQLADVNQSLNRVGRSLGYLGHALAVAAQPSARPMERWAFLTQIAFSLDTLRLNHAALSYQKEALSLALEAGEPLRVSRSYGYVGAAYAALKLYPDALENARRAFDIGAGMQGDPNGREIMGNASLWLGDIYRQSGNCTEALEAYDRSIGLYGGLGDEYYAYPAHKGKLLCLAAGTDDGALDEELHTVLTLSERNRSKITAESQRVSYFDREQGVYDLAIGYEATRVKDPARAYEYSEASRARSLNDAIELGAEVLKKGYGMDLHLPEEARPLTLEQVQAGMPEGAQILQYAVLEDRLIIWVLTKSGLSQEEVGVGGRQLSEKVDAYLTTVRKPPAGDDDGGAAQLAAELYRTLIAPAEPHLDKKKYLCVVPDKALNRLPFSALVSPSGRYLLEDYEVGVAPNSTIFVGLSATAATKASASAESLLSVGDPSFSRSSFPDLPGLASAASEAAKVSEFYGPRRSLLLRGDASESRVRAELIQAEVAHLALHYVANPGSEMLSGFPLAPEAGGAHGPRADGFLQFHELYGLKLPRTRLVVLSACETGVEREYAGEGAVGVTRPFLVAGVPVIVASLWPVDSAASSELMVSFHRHRTRNHLASANALRRAQSEMARGADPRHRHPFYWAAFVPVGAHTTF